MTLALQLAPGQHVIDEVTGRVVLALSVVLPLDTPSGRGLLYVREDDGHEHAIGLEVARAVEL